MPLLSISFQLFHLVCHKDMTTPFICYIKRFIVVLFCFKGKHYYLIPAYDFHETSYASR